MAVEKDDNFEGQEGQPEEAFSGLSFPNIGEEEPQEEPQDDLAAKVAAMEARLEAETKAFQEERSRWQQTVDKLIQTQATRPSEPQQPQQPQVPSFHDLPDPVDKPEEFKQALQQRMHQQFQAHQQELQKFQQTQQTQQSFASQLDNLWSQFQQKHSDLAPKQALLQGVVGQERARMEQQGLDVQQAILADPDGFMDRVATKMREELGQPAAPQQQQQPVNRTGGLGTGSNVNGKGGSKPQGFAGFVDQIKKSQLDDGLY
jgi:hypothetical protein